MEEYLKELERLSVIYGQGKIPSSELRKIESLKAADNNSTMNVYEDWHNDQVQLYGSERQFDNRLGNDSERTFTERSDARQDELIDKGIVATSDKSLDNSMLADRQSTGEQAWRAGNRLWQKTGLGIMEQTFDMLDFFPGYGNSVSNAAREMKRKVDEDNKIYTKESDSFTGLGDANFDMGSLLDTGENLMSSIFSFAATGAMAGGIVNKASQGLGWIAKQNKIRQALEYSRNLDMRSEAAASTLTNFRRAGMTEEGAKQLTAAYLLNKAESTAIAKDAYDNVKKQGIAKGLDEQQAHNIALESSTETYRINQFNTFLNMGAASMFMRYAGRTNIGARAARFFDDVETRFDPNSGMMRQFQRNPFLNNLKNYAGEGVQESLEELNNSLGQDVGEKRGAKRISGQDNENLLITDWFKEVSEFDVKDANDMIAGAIGGIGQTSLVDGVGSALVDKFATTINDKIGKDLFGYSTPSTYTENVYNEDGTIKHKKGDVKKVKKALTYNQDRQYEIGDTVTVADRTETDENGNAVVIPGYTRIINTIEDSNEEAAKDNHKNKKGDVITDENGNEISVDTADTEYETDAQGRKKFVSNKTLRQTETQKRIDTFNSLTKQQQEALLSANVQQNVNNSIATINNIIYSGQELRNNDDDIQSVVDDNMMNIARAANEFGLINGKKQDITTPTGANAITDFAENLKTKTKVELAELADTFSQFSIAEQVYSNKLNGAISLPSYYEAIKRLSPEDAANAGLTADYKQRAEQALELYNKYDFTYDKYNGLYEPDQVKDLYYNTVAKDMLTENNNTLRQQLTQIMQSGNVSQSFANVNQVLDSLSEDLSSNLDGIQANPVLSSLYTQIQALKKDLLNYNNITGRGANALTMASEKAVKEKDLADLQKQFEEEKKKIGMTNKQNSYSRAKAINALLVLGISQTEAESIVDSHIKIDENTGEINKLIKASDSILSSYTTPDSIAKKIEAQRKKYIEENYGRLMTNRRNEILKMLMSMQGAVGTTDFGTNVTSRILYSPEHLINLSSEEGSLVRQIAESLNQTLEGKVEEFLKDLKEKQESLNMKNLEANVPLDQWGFVDLANVKNGKLFSEKIAPSFNEKGEYVEGSHILTREAYDDIVNDLVLDYFKINIRPDEVRDNIIQDFRDNETFYDAAIISTIAQINMPYSAYLPFEVPTTMQEFFIANFGSSPLTGELVEENGSTYFVPFQYVTEEEAKKNPSLLVVHDVNNLDTAANSPNKHIIRNPKNRVKITNQNFKNVSIVEKNYAALNNGLREGLSFIQDRQRAILDSIKEKEDLLTSPEYQKLRNNLKNDFDKRDGEELEKEIKTLQEIYDTITEMVDSEGVYLKDETGVDISKYSLAQLENLLNDYKNIKNLKETEDKLKEYQERLDIIKSNRNKHVEKLKELSKDLQRHKKEGDKIYKQIESNPDLDDDVKSELLNQLQNNLGLTQKIKHEIENTRHSIKILESQIKKIETEMNGVVQVDLKNTLNTVVLNLRELRTTEIEKLRSLTAQLKTLTSEIKVLTKILSIAPQLIDDLLSMDERTEQLERFIIEDIKAGKSALSIQKSQEALRYLYENRQKAYQFLKGQFANKVNKDTVDRVFAQVSEYNIHAFRDVVTEMQAQKDDLTSKLNTLSDVKKILNSSKTVLGMAKKLRDYAKKNDLLKQQISELEKAVDNYEEADKVFNYSWTKNEMVYSDSEKMSVLEEAKQLVIDARLLVNASGKRIDTSILSVLNLPKIDMEEAGKVIGMIESAIRQATENNDMTMLVDMFTNNNIEIENFKNAIPTLDANIADIINTANKYIAITDALEKTKFEIEQKFQIEKGKLEREYDELETTIEDVLTPEVEEAIIQDDIAETASDIVEPILESDTEEVKKDKQTNLADTIKALEEDVKTPDSNDIQVPKRDIDVIVDEEAKTGKVVDRAIGNSQLNIDEFIVPVVYSVFEQGTPVDGKITDAFAISGNKILIDNPLMMAYQNILANVYNDNSNKSYVAKYLHANHLEAYQKEYNFDLDKLGTWNEEEKTFVKFDLSYGDDGKLKPTSTQMLMLVFEKINDKLVPAVINVNGKDYYVTAPFTTTTAKAMKRYEIDGKTHTIGNAIKKIQDFSNALGDEANLNIALGKDTEIELNKNSIAGSFLNNTNKQIFEQMSPRLIGDVNSPFQTFNDIEFKIETSPNSSSLGNLVISSSASWNNNPNNMPFSNIALAVNRMSNEDKRMGLAMALARALYTENELGKENFANYGNYRYYFKTLSNKNNANKNNTGLFVVSEKTLSEKKQSAVYGDIMKFGYYDENNKYKVARITGKDAIKKALHYLHTGSHLDTTNSVLNNKIEEFVKAINDTRLNYNISKWGINNNIPFSTPVKLAETKSVYKVVFSTNKVNYKQWIVNNKIVNINLATGPVKKIGYYVKQDLKLLQTLNIQITKANSLKGTPAPNPASQQTLPQNTPANPGVQPSNASTKIEGTVPGKTKKERYDYIVANNGDKFITGTNALNTAQYLVLANENANTKTQKKLLEIQSDAFATNFTFGNTIVFGALRRIYQNDGSIMTNLVDVNSNNSTMNLHHKSLLNLIYAYHTSKAEDIKADIQKIFEELNNAYAYDLDLTSYKNLYETLYNEVKNYIKESGSKESMTDKYVFKTTEVVEKEIVEPETLNDDITVSSVLNKDSKDVANLYNELIAGFSRLPKGYSSADSDISMTGMILSSQFDEVTRDFGGHRLAMHGMKDTLSGLDGLLKLFLGSKGFGFYEKNGSTQLHTNPLSASSIDGNSARGADTSGGYTSGFFTLLSKEDRGRIGSPYDIGAILINDELLTTIPNIVETLRMLLKQSPFLAGDIIIDTYSNVAKVSSALTFVNRYQIESESAPESIDIVSQNFEYLEQYLNPKTGLYFQDSTPIIGIIKVEIEGKEYTSNVYFKSYDELVDTITKQVGINDADEVKFIKDLIYNHDMSDGYDNALVKLKDYLKPKGRNTTYGHLQLLIHAENLQKIIGYDESADKSGSKSIDPGKIIKAHKIQPKQLDVDLTIEQDTENVNNNVEPQITSQELDATFNDKLNSYIENFDDNKSPADITNDLKEVKIQHGDKGVDEYINALKENDYITINQIPGIRAALNNPSNRLSTSTEYESLDIQTARQNIQNYFGNSVQVRELNINSIVNIHDQGLMGRYYNAIIELFHNSEIGTEHHEAIHAVFDLYLSPRERNIIYNEFRSRNNYAALLQPFYALYKDIAEAKEVELLKEKLNKEKGKRGGEKSVKYVELQEQLNDAELSLENAMIEEYIAEEFRGVRLGEISFEKLGWSDKTKTILNKIWEFIKLLFGNPQEAVNNILKKKSNTEKLYKALAQGQFKNKKPNQNSSQSAKNRMIEIKVGNEIKTIDETYLDAYVQGAKADFFRQIGEPAMLINFVNKEVSSEKFDEYLKVSLAKYIDLYLSTLSEAEVANYSKISNPSDRTKNANETNASYLERVLHPQVYTMLQDKITESFRLSGISLKFEKSKISNHEINNPDELSDDESRSVVAEDGSPLTREDLNSERFNKGTINISDKIPPVLQYLSMSIPTLARDANGKVIPATEQYKKDNYWIDNINIEASGYVGETTKYGTTPTINVKRLWAILYFNVSPESNGTIESLLEALDAAVDTEMGKKDGFYELMLFRDKIKSIYNMHLQSSFDNSSNSYGTSQLSTIVMAAFNKQMSLFKPGMITNKLGQSVNSHVNPLDETNQQVITRLYKSNFQAQLDNFGGYISNDFVAAFEELVNPANPKIDLYAALEMLGISLNLSLGKDMIVDLDAQRVARNTAVTKYLNTLKSTNNNDVYTVEQLTVYVLNKLREIAITNEIRKEENSKLTPPKPFTKGVFDNIYSKKIDLKLKKASDVAPTDSAPMPTEEYPSISMIAQDEYGNVDTVEDENVILDDNFNDAIYQKMELFPFLKSIINRESISNPIAGTPMAKTPSGELQYGLRLHMNLSKVIDKKFNASLKKAHKLYVKDEFDALNLQNYYRIVVLNDAENVVFDKSLQEDLDKGKAIYNNLKRYIAKYAPDLFTVNSENSVLINTSIVYNNPIELVISQGIGQSDKIAGTDTVNLDGATRLYQQLTNSIDGYNSVIRSADRGIEMTIRLKNGENYQGINEHEKYTLVNSFKQFNEIWSGYLIDELNTVVLEKNGLLDSVNDSFISKKDNLELGFPGYANAKKSARNKRFRFWDSIFKSTEKEGLDLQLMVIGKMLNVTAITPEAIAKSLNVSYQTNPSLNDLNNSFTALNELLVSDNTNAASLFDRTILSPEIKNQIEKVLTKYLQSRLFGTNPLGKDNSSVKKHDGILTMMETEGLFKAPNGRLKIIKDEENENVLEWVSSTTYIGVDDHQLSRFKEDTDTYDNVFTPSYLKGKSNSAYAKDKALQALLVSFVMNQETLYYENFKLLLGDIASLKNLPDTFKRAGGSTSTTGSMMTYDVSPEYDENGMLDVNKLVAKRKQIPFTQESKAQRPLFKFEVKVDDNVVNIFENTEKREENIKLFRQASREHDIDAKYELLKQLVRNNATKNNNITSSSKIELVSWNFDVAFSLTNRDYTGNTTTLVGEDIDFISKIAKDKTQVETVSVSLTNNKVVISYLDAKNNAINESELSELTKIHVKNYVYLRHNEIKKELAKAKTADAMKKVSDKYGKLALKHSQIYSEPFKGKATEADAQGLITLDAHRMYKIFSDENYGTKEQEAYGKAVLGLPLTYKESHVFQPLKTQHFGALQNYLRHGKNINKLGLTAAQIEWLTKNQLIDNNALTALGERLLSSLVNQFQKKSLAPLVPYAIKGTNLEVLNNWMIDNGVDTFIYESGVKIGAPSKKPAMYDNNGVVSNKNFDGSVISEIRLDQIGIQVQIADKVKTEQLIGTQETKIQLGHFFEAGRIDMGQFADMPFDVDDNGTIMTNQEAAEMLIRDYEDSQEALVDNERYKFFVAVGITSHKGKLTINNKELFTQIILDEAKARNLEASVIANIKLFSDKAYKRSINGQSYEGAFVEEMLNSRKIDNIINAVIRSRMIKIHLNGGPKIQEANTGYELRAIDADGDFVDITKKGKGKKDEPAYTVTKRTKDGKFHSSNETLRFYKMSKNGSKLLPAQCMLSLPKKLINYVNNVFGDLDTFNKVIELVSNKYYNFYDNNDSSTEKIKWQTLNVTNANGESFSVEEKTLFELMKVIGFRIPTQSIASNEIMLVKKFLPYEKGESIIVPSEIVTKTGGDFDLDKLNAYLQNFKIYSDEIVLGSDEDGSTVEKQYINYMTHILKGSDIKIKVPGFTEIKKTFVEKSWAILDVEFASDEFKSYKDELVSAFNSSKNVVDLLSANDIFLESIAEALDNPVYRKRKFDSDETKELVTSEKNNLKRIKSEFKKLNAIVFDSVAALGNNLSGNVGLEMLRFDKFKDAYVNNPALTKYGSDLENFSFNAKFTLNQMPISAGSLLTPIDSPSMKNDEIGMLPISKFLSSNSDELKTFSAFVRKRESEIRKEFLNRKEVMSNPTTKLRIFAEVARQTENKFQELFNIWYTANASDASSDADTYSDVLSIEVNKNRFVSFLAGKAGVGQAAVHVTSHNLALKANLHMLRAVTIQVKDNNTLITHDQTLMNFNINHLIKYEQNGRMIDSGIILKFPLHELKFDKATKTWNRVQEGVITENDVFNGKMTDVTTLYGHPSFASRTAVNGSPIFDTLSGFVNAYVDIAKEPFIFGMNMGNATANTVLMLVRLGMPPKEIAALLKQPAIVKYVINQRNNENALVKAYDLTVQNEVIVTKTLFEYDYMVKDHIEEIFKSNIENSQELARAISKTTGSEKLKIEFDWHLNNVENMKNIVGRYYNAWAGYYNAKLNDSYVINNDSLYDHYKNLSEKLEKEIYQGIYVKMEEYTNDMKSSTTSFSGRPVLSKMHYQYSSINVLYGNKMTNDANKEGNAYANKDYGFGLANLFAKKIGSYYNLKYDTVDSHQRQLDKMYKEGKIEGQLEKFPFTMYYNKETKAPSNMSYFSSAIVRANSFGEKLNDARNLVSQVMKEEDKNAQAKIYEELVSIFKEQKEYLDAFLTAQKMSKEFQAALRATTTNTTGISGEFVENERMIGEYDKLYMQNQYVGVEQMRNNSVLKGYTKAQETTVKAVNGLYLRNVLPYVAGSIDTIAKNIQTNIKKSEVEYVTQHFLSFLNIISETNNPESAFNELAIVNDDTSKYKDHANKTATLGTVIDLLKIHLNKPMNGKNINAFSQGVLDSLIANNVKIFIKDEKYSNKTLAQQKAARKNIINLLLRNKDFFKIFQVEKGNDYMSYNDYINRKAVYKDEQSFDVISKARNFKLDDMNRPIIEEQSLEIASNFEELNQDLLRLSNLQFGSVPNMSRYDTFLANNMNTISNITNVDKFSMLSETEQSVLVDEFYNQFYALHAYYGDMTNYAERLRKAKRFGFVYAYMAKIENVEVEVGKIGGNPVMRNRQQITLQQFESEDVTSPDAHYLVKPNVKAGTLNKMLGYSPYSFINRVNEIAQTRINLLKRETEEFATLEKSLSDFISNLDENSPLNNLIIEC